MTYEQAKAIILPCSIYRHYKGGYYEIIAIAKHTETGEPIVIYQDAKIRGITWARPADMWFDTIDGVSRFTKVKTVLKQK